MKVRVYNILKYWNNHDWVDIPFEFPKEIIYDFSKEFDFEYNETEFDIYDLIDSLLEEIEVPKEYDYLYNSFEYDYEILSN